MHQDNISKHEKPIEEVYTSGEFWDDLPDFLAWQAPGKIRHLSRFIDFDLILRSLPNPNRCVIADIGCGAGLVSTGLAEHLRKQYPNVSFEVYGYDLSPQAIDVAKKALAPNAHFECKRFENADMIWDFAILCDVIEHVEDPYEFVRNAALKSRYFVVGYAMDDNLANRMDKKRHAVVNSVGHISLFHEKRALDVSGKYGDIIASSYIRNPFLRNFVVKKFLHVFTSPIKFVLQCLSPRIKGKIFGGESIFILTKSRIFNSSFKAHSDK